MLLSPAGRRTVTLGLLVGVGACEMSSLPTAPSDLTSGVSIYEHANFAGDSALLTTSYDDLSEFSGPCEHSESDGYGTTHYYDWNDCMSSLKVAGGWRAIIYRDDDYKGQSMEITSDVSNLQLVGGSCSHDGLNDCITSIKVIAPGHAF
jgi:hypothetical protein